MYKYFSLKVLLFQSRSMNNTTHCWRYAFSLSIVLTVFDFVWFEKENIVCSHKWQRKVVNLVFMEQYTSKLTKQCKCEKRNISPHNVLRKHVMYNNYNLKQKTFFQKKEIVHYVVTTNRINFNRKVSDTYEVIMYYPFLLFQYEWM